MSDATGAIPSDIEHIANIPYGKGGGRRLYLDIVRPLERPERPMPVVVWIHGGAWRGGNKESGIRRLIPYAQRGYFGVSVSYRLSQEATYPAQIEDCKCAIRFLRAQAMRFHLDPDRIGVWGPSAGGHLVALLGTATDLFELEGSGGWPYYSSRVQAVCDWYGPTDFLQMDRATGGGRHDSPDSPESQLIGAPIQEHPDLVARANPITYVTGNEPPFLIMHGDQDRTVPHHQSQLLYEALTRAGAREVTFHTLEGADHGGPHFETAESLGMVAAFFDRHLR
ncbi:MAG TPA: alpha/beta hydrolase [Chloroflexi bacterium]|jgi:acetyl esterase/lipase|nr:alpha/beta hydrolase [Chloroflexota bacterium]